MSRPWVAALVGLDVAIEPEAVHVDDAWLGPGFGHLTPASLEAIGLAARLDGLYLEPVYTARAAAALSALARRRALPLAPEAPTVLLHTGGLPALFAFAAELTAPPAPAPRPDLETREDAP